MDCMALAITRRGTEKHDVVPYKYGSVERNAAGAHISCGRYSGGCHCGCGVGRCGRNHELCRRGSQEWVAPVVGVGGDVNGTGGVDGIRGDCSVGGSESVCVDAS